MEDGTVDSESENVVEVGKVEDTSDGTAEESKIVEGSSEESEDALVGMRLVESESKSTEGSSDAIKEGTYEEESEFALDGIAESKSAEGWSEEEDDRTSDAKLVDEIVGIILSTGGACEGDRDSGEDGDSLSTVN